MRSKNTKLYARYYLLLEKCIKYYNDYQNELKEKFIIKLKSKIDSKDKKICKLEEKLDNIIKQNDHLITKNEETTKQNNELLKLIKESNSKLDDMNDKLDIANEELEETTERLDSTDKTLEIVTKKLDIAVEDRVINPRKSSIREYFVLMKNDKAEYKYYAIRGQKRYILKKKEKLDDYEQIKVLECVPNSTILWNLMKQELKNKIESCGNKINLVDITEDYFVNSITNIYNKRKLVDV